MKVAPFVPEYKKLEDLIIFKILRWKSTILGLFAPNLINNASLSVFYVFYSLVISIFLIIVCIWTIYNKICFIYPLFIVTVGILDGASILVATITNVVSIICATLLRTKSIVQITKLLKEVEKSINEKLEMFQFDQRVIIGQFASLEIFIISYTIFDSAIILRDTSPWYFCISLMTYLNVIWMSATIMQVHFFSTCIRQYFQVLNKKLLEITNKQQRNTKFFLKLSDKLCDIVVLVSKAYGVQIVLISLIIILNLIESMNLLMKYALGILTLQTDFNFIYIMMDTWNSVIYIVSNLKIFNDQYIFYRFLVLY